MRRPIVSMLVVLGVLSVSCTQEDEILQSAGLQGAYDLALVNDLLFVTSTDRDELRVLSLDADATKRRFVRAPNPLEPLSLPVLDRPQALTRDTRYVDGVDRAGPYLYARSNGSTEISVVGAAREELREVRRLDTRELSATQTPDRRSLGPVTAFAALAPDPAVEGSPSTLYYTTQESSGPRLWRIRLPSSPQALRDAPALTVEPIAFSLPDIAELAVNALLVMPQRGTSEVLALSTRRDTVRGKAARSYRLDLESGTLQALNFGGAQVLQLATHGRVPGAEGQPDLLAAGKRIYGVLDTSNCREVQICSLGVLAVDSTTGTLENDATGYPMLPVNFGIGLPTGLSLSTNTRLLRQGGETREAAVSLLGIMPLSNGIILFFDALNLLHLNVSSWSTVTGETVNTATSSVTLVTVQGTSRDASADIAVEGLTFGVTRDESYVLTYEGTLPGMDSLERDPDTTVFEVPYAEDAAKTPVVRPGDIITLLPAGTGLQACGTDVTVRAVEPSSSASTRLLVPAGALPESCASYPRFQVRASGGQPLVLTDGGGTYLQRLGRGDPYTRNGEYFFHPPGYQGQTGGSAFSLRYVRDLNDPAARPGRGDRLVVSTNAHFIPYVIGVDLVNVPSLTPFRLPGTVVQARVGGEQGSDYAYIVYPSANGVLQVDLSSITAGAANRAGLFPYL